MRAHLPTLLWAVLIAVGLLMPESELARVGPLPEWAPSTAHLFLFLVLAFLLYRSLRAALWRRPALAALLLTVLYGLVLELAQIGIAGRAFEWRDLAVNGLGSLAGVAGARIAASSWR